MGINAFVKELKNMYCTNTISSLIAFLAAKSIIIVKIKIKLGRPRLLNNLMSTVSLNFLIINILVYTVIANWIIIIKFQKMIKHNSCVTVLR